MAPKKDIPDQVCCNPFNNHRRRVKGVRPISIEFTDRYPSVGLRVGNKLCGPCRKRIITQSPRNSPEAQDVAGPSTVVEVLEFEVDTVTTLNETLSPLGISPFKKKRLQRSKQYAKGKVKRVGTAIKLKLKTLKIEVSSTSSSDDTAESEIVRQLKDAFHASTKKSSKTQILTILPKSWTRKTIVEKFGATDYMVRRAKELVREKVRPDLPSDPITLLHTIRDYEWHEIRRFILPHWYEIMRIASVTACVLCCLRVKETAHAVLFVYLVWCIGRSFNI